MAVKRAEHQIVVEAPPQACFDALLDYESYPSWQRAVTATDVLTRDRRGRGEDVAFEIDARVRRVNYTLRYSYEPPHRIAWDFVEGDVREVDGEMILEDRGDGTTLATYSLVLDPGVWLPGRLARMLSDQVMRGSLEDLKRRVEG